MRFSLLLLEALVCVHAVAAVNLERAAIMTGELGQLCDTREPNGRDHASNTLTSTVTV